jgi:hypothetical protein
VSSEKFFLEYNYDIDFLNLFFVGWQHAFSESDAIVATFLGDVSDQTLAILLNWSHTFGNFTLQPGITTTFGNASWNTGPNKATVYAFRDIGPLLSANLDTEWFYAETFNGLFIPIRESQSTAYWVGISRFFAAVKWNGFGIGPRRELYYSKPGDSSFELDEVRIGGSIFKKFNKSSLEFFLGYNPIAVASFFGVPIIPGPVFRVAFSQEF